MAYSYKKYEESDAVRNAQDALKNQAASKPGQYTSQWQQQLDDIMGKIQNREKFTYDVNGDALYNQYKDQYVRNGKLAMQDTMGQAAALTGGYGNSYAQQVGQQTYQGYLTGLTDKIPELYQMALNKYQMDGDALQKQYAILGDREQQDYGRYQDALSAWQNDRNFLYDQYNQERTWDYGRYTDDRNNDYSVWQDNAARAQAQVEYLLSIGVTPSDELLEASGLDKQYVSGKLSQWQAAQAPQTGYGGSSSSKESEDQEESERGRSKDVGPMGYWGSGNYYRSAYNAAMEAARTGITEMEVNKYLNELVNRGELSGQEAMRVAKEYRANKR